jgi:hypothetical protein
MVELERQLKSELDDTPQGNQQTDNNAYPMAVICCVLIST